MIKLSDETLETLTDAIKDFNDWNGNARICYNKENNTFFTVVFHNDVMATESILHENCFAVYSKKEIEGNLKIGKNRRSYIEKFVNLVLDGWQPFQAEYQLLNG